MKSFKELDEKRSNSDLNLRIPAYDYIISRGYDHSDYFFTFTSFKKVGINPTSQWNTPNGIYCFPSSILKNLRGSMNNVPFVYDSPYINVLKRVSMAGCIDPLSSYRESDLNRDNLKLTDIFRKNIRNFDDVEMIQIYRRIVEEAEYEAKNNTPIARLWNITRRLSSEEFIKDAFKWKGVKGKEVTFRLTKDKYLSKTPGFTLDPDMHLHKEFFRGVKSSPQAWNNLLRRLGYECFVDSEATGIIHQNEPLQAVFLSSKNFEVVDLIENKSYTRLKEYSEIDIIINELKKKNTVTVTGGAFSQSFYIIPKFKDNFKDCDLEGCEININPSGFFINKGKIKKADFTSRTIDIHNCNILGGNFHTTNIHTSKIEGGSFGGKTVFDDCNIINGKFTDVVISNIYHIIGGIFFDTHINNLILMGGEYDKCRINHCTFMNKVSFKYCDIYGSSNIKKIIDDPDVNFYYCYIDLYNLKDGKYRYCTINSCDIKGGTFELGSIQNSSIKDGNFKSVKIDKDTNKIDGGNIQ